jgi:hypothetical protein
MKTLALIIIAAFLIPAAGSQASSGKDRANPKKTTVHINILQAMQDPGLTEVIHNQVNSTFLKNHNQQIYSVDIVYKNYIYKVSGTYSQWAWFFSPILENLGLKRNDIRLD